ncbi:MAG: helicase C-terminal domain-containing protein [Opitutales bacterium]
MQLHVGERRVSLSVGEFASFKVGPTGGRGGFAPWRAQAGTIWHQTLRSDLERTTAAARFEVPIEGVLLESGWRFELQGRVDQWLDGARPCIREVKTVQRSLPEDAETLRAAYPEYLRQVAAYQFLAQILADAPPVDAELVFVGLRDGFQQVLAMESAAEGEALVRAQARQMVRFLEERWQAQTRRATLTVKPAFATLREGQADALAQLRQAVGAGAAKLLMEAPTGFGKTGLAWQWALEGLRDGHWTHVIYATGKSTGQLEVTRQLDAMLEPESLRYFQMRGRAETTSGCPVSGCAGPGPACREQVEARWERSGLHPLGIFGKGPTVSGDELRSQARLHGICPYEIARTLLPWADIWVGDFNYVFSPRHRGVFLEQLGFNARRTLLIVDEAHNLPERAAAACSGFASAAEAAEIEDGLRAALAPAALRSPWVAWVEFLEGLEASEAHSPTVEMELAAHLEVLSEAVMQVPLDFERVGPALIEALWELPALRQLYENEAIEKLLWSPKNGELRLDCLDASREIGQSLRDFGCSLLMSATLTPQEAMEASLGLEPGQARWISAQALWREAAYRVAVDCRVDTRYAHRDSYHPVTARTVSAFHADGGQPIAVFFPSYRYAAAVQAHLQAMDPAFRVVVQPRGFDLAGQQEWIYEALIFADALFLVLGGSFAEGVDLLGGRIERAMIVGPALPEVNALQKARMERSQPGGRNAAFRTVYQIPGLRKVNQALGRLVRAPGQTAVILLHGKRFAQPDYAALLGIEYQEGRRILDEADFVNWLESLRNSPRLP